MPRVFIWPCDHFNGHFTLLLTEAGQLSVTVNENDYICVQLAMVQVRFTQRSRKRMGEERCTICTHNQTKLVKQYAKTWTIRLAMGK